MVVALSEHLSESRGIVVDVREDLRQGREPFQKIMAAAEHVPAGGSFTLYATFKPTPLIAVLQGQGFEAEAEAIGEGDWRVIFVRKRHETHDDSGEGGSDPMLGSSDVPVDDGAGRSSDIRLDNRGLEPPEPMVRTLEAIHGLKPGQRIVGAFDRRPMFLLPKLDQMGLGYEINDNSDGSVTLIISWQA